MKLKPFAAPFSLVLCLVVLTSACAKNEDAPVSNKPAPVPATAVPALPVAEVTELKMEDIKVGIGAVAEVGKSVTVHYTGTFPDGKKFDSSVDRKEPFTFKLGAGRVIKGWDEGVAGMRIGGKRKLIIPSELGYGKKGAGGVIPPDAVLHFDVELLGVE